MAVTLASGCGRVATATVCDDMDVVPVTVVLDLGEGVVELLPGPGSEDCLQTVPGTALSGPDSAGLVTARVRLFAKAASELAAIVSFVADDDGDPLREPRAVSYRSAVDRLGRRAFIPVPGGDPDEAELELAFRLPLETTEPVVIIATGEIARLPLLGLRVHAEELLAGEEVGDITSTGWRWNANILDYYGTGYLVSAEEGASPLTVAMNVPVAGEYAVWVRDYGYSNEGTTRLVLNGTPLAPQGADLQGTFAWERVGSVTLPGGEVELTFEDVGAGVSVTDEVLIVPAEEDDPAAWAADRFAVLPPADAHTMVRRFYVQLLPEIPPPSDLAEWTAERDAWLAEVEAAVHLEPLPPSPPDEPILVDTIDNGEYRIEKLLFPDLMGMEVGATLYLPLDISSPVPVILNPIGHWSDGTALEYVQTRCAMFARLGMAALAMDPPGYGERRLPGNDHYFGMQSYLIGDLTSRIYLGEWRRALDWLETRPEIDPTRVGVTGASGGGWASLYLAIVEPRITAAAPVSEVATWEQLTLILGGGDPEQHPVGLGTMPFGVLLALVAPRPLFVVNGVSDIVFPAANAEPPVLWAEAVYAAYGAPDNIGFMAAPGAHGYYQDRREAVAGFFAEHLLGLTGPVSEAPMALLSRSALDVGIDPDGTTLADLHASLAAGLPPPVPTTSAALEDWRTATTSALLASMEAPGLAPSAVAEIELAAGVRYLVLTSEPGIDVPVVLLTPQGTDPPWDAVVYYAEAGKAAAIHAPALLAAGLAVLLVEPRQTDETYEPRFLIREARRPPMHAMLYGRTLPGSRMLDLTTAVSWAAGEPDFDSIGVLVDGESAGLVGLLAAALDTRISALGVSRTVLSLRSSFDERVIPAPGLLAPELLFIADLPELAALVAPRPVRVFGAIGPDRAPRDSDLEAAWASTAMAYDLLGSPAAFGVESWGLDAGERIASFFAASLP